MKTTEYPNLDHVEREHWYYSGKRDIVQNWIQRCRPLPPPTSANYATLQTAEGQFAAIVESDPSAVSTKPYQLVCWFGEDAALILRRDLIEHWHSLPAGKFSTPK